LCDASHTACTSGATPYRVSTVCVSMDEQFADARNAIALCHSTVGHISGTVFIDSYDKLHTVHGNLCMQ